MAGAQPDHVLVGAAVPIDRQAQRIVLCVELERDHVALGNPHPQPRAATAVEHEAKVDAGVQAGEDDRPACALGRR